MKPLLALAYMFLSMLGMLKLAVWLVPLAMAGLIGYPVFAITVAIFAAAVVLSLWAVSVLKVFESLN